LQFYFALAGYRSNRGWVRKGQGVLFEIPRCARNDDGGHLNRASSLTSLRFVRDDDRAMGDKEVGRDGARFLTTFETVPPPRPPLTRQSRSSDCSDSERRNLKQI